jgi:hypothetical protein
MRVIVGNCLPESAAAKLIALEDEAAAAESAARVAAERLAQLPRDSDQRVIARLVERRAAESNRHQSLAQLCNNLTAWVNKVRVPLEVVEAPPVELADGETIAAAIERTRDAIAALQHRLEAARTAPAPKAVDKKRAADEVAERVQRGRPRYDSRPDRLVIDHIDAQRMDFASVINDCLDKMAWLNPEAFLEAYNRDIDAIPTRADALAPDERQRRTAELVAELEALERCESALIDRAAAEGVVIFYREDHDPKCVLQVRAALRVQAVA